MSLLWRRTVGVSCPLASWVEMYPSGHTDSRDMWPRMLCICPALGWGGVRGGALVERSSAVLCSTQTGDFVLLDGKLVVICDFLVHSNGLLGVNDDLLLGLNGDDLRITVWLQNITRTIFKKVRKQLYPHFYRLINNQHRCYSSNKYMIEKLTAYSRAWSWNLVRHQRQGMEHSLNAGR